MLEIFIIQVLMTDNFNEAKVFASREAAKGELVYLVNKGFLFITNLFTENYEIYYTN